MGLDHVYEDGQTPLDDDEKEGLRMQTIATRQELDEMEQLNIEAAVEWSLKNKFLPEQILTENFVNGLHEKMFGDVWQWAGKFRKTNKNIGLDKLVIATSLKQLLDDCDYWIKNKSFGEDEISIRFKHRLVSIHCYPNGNGRHSRLMADIIISRIFEKNEFTWGYKSPGSKNAIRKNYLSALGSADKNDFQPLIEFARS
jgi:Fic-DOC domain mobile mystery protein B